MKICIVSPVSVYPPTWGAGKRVWELAKHLCLYGNTVYLLHPGSTNFFSGSLRLVSYKGFETVSMLKGFKWNGGLDLYLHPFNLLFIPQLYSLLSKGKVDIVQGEVPFSVLPTFFLTKKFGIPYILDSHDMRFADILSSGAIPILAYYAKIFEEYALNHASLILSVCERDKNSLSSYYGISKNRIIVIPNGVDLKEYTKIEQRKKRMKLRLGLNPKEKVIIFHGALNIRANHEAAKMIIEKVAPMVLNECHDTTFIIIGRNPSRSLFKHGLPKVKIPGFVENITDYIAVADLCVVPIMRGHGPRLKLLEYFSAGKPVVTTNAGANGFPLENGKHAFIYKNINERFIEMVKELLINETLCEKIGLNARAFAERYDWSVITAILHETYQKLTTEFS